MEHLNYRSVTLSKSSAPIAFSYVAHLIAVINLPLIKDCDLGHGGLNVFSLTECPPPGPGNLTNGLVEGYGSIYRSTYRFVCNDGYVLLGHDTVTCTENGTWNGTTPSCLKGNKLCQQLGGLISDSG